MNPWFGPFEPFNYDPGKVTVLVKKCDLVIVLVYQFFVCPVYFRGKKPASLCLVSFSFGYIVLYICWRSPVDMVLKLNLSLWVARRERALSELTSCAVSH